MELARPQAEKSAILRRTFFRVRAAGAEAGDDAKGVELLTADELVLHSPPEKARDAADRLVDLGVDVASVDPSLAECLEPQRTELANRYAAEEANKIFEARFDPGDLARRRPRIVDVRA